MRVEHGYMEKEKVVNCMNDILEMLDKKYNLNGIETILVLRETTNHMKKIYGVVELNVAPESDVVN